MIILRGHGDWRDMPLSPIQTFVTGLTEPVAETTGPHGGGNFAIIGGGFALVGHAAGEKAGPRGRTERLGTIGAIETDPSGREAVHGRGFQVGISGATQGASGLLIRCDQQDVGLVLHGK
jgi:hypothetical protein